jgi:hypothetical protein
LVIWWGGCVPSPTKSYKPWDGIPWRPSVANENPFSLSLDVDALGNIDCWKWIVGDEWESMNGATSEGLKGGEGDRRERKFPNESQINIQ